MKEQHIRALTLSHSERWEVTRERERERERTKTNDAAVGKMGTNLVWEATALSVAYTDPDIINHLIPTSDGGAM